MRRECEEVGGPGGVGRRGTVGEGGGGGPRVECGEGEGEGGGWGG